MSITTGKSLEKKQKFLNCQLNSYLRHLNEELGTTIIIGKYPETQKNLQTARKQFYTIFFIIVNFKYMQIKDV